MFYMGNFDGMINRNVEDAAEFILSCRYATLATSHPETGARLSALSNLQGQCVGELFFATDVNSQKVANIRQNPVGELMFTNGESQIILRGKMEVLTDPASRKAKWQDWMTNYFPDGLEGSTMCVIKFTTAAVRAMLV